MLRKTHAESKESLCLIQPLQDPDSIAGFMHYSIYFLYLLDRSPQLLSDFHFRRSYVLGYNELMGSKMVVQGTSVPTGLHQALRGESFG